MLGIAAFLVIIGCIYWLYKHRTPAPAQQHDWVSKFSVHYITESLCLFASNEGDVPERVVGLMEDKIAGGTQQTFIVCLGDFIREECDRDLRQGDYQVALADVRKLLTAQTARINSNSELRRLISAMHEEEEGTEITLKELNEAYNEIMNNVRSSKETAAWVMGKMLRFNMETMFKQMFGMRYNDYLQAKYPKSELASISATAQA